MAAIAVMTALAAPPALGAETVKMQALLNADGSGRLFVNNAPSPGGAWSWEACSANRSACAPFGGGAEISTGAAAPGTVFRVSGEGGTGLSPVWHGNLKLVASPTVTGAIRANELVTPAPASWSGGWDGDFDLTQLAACTTAEGQDCLSITDPKYIDGCPDGATVIDPALTGRYLRVADRRYGAGTAFTAEAFTSPYGRPIWPADGSTAVAMLGPILPATGPRAAACGPPPLAGLPPAPPSSSPAPSKANGTKGTATVRCASECRAVVVTVQCATDCRVVLAAKRGRHRVWTSSRPYRTESSGSYRPVTLRLNHRRLQQLGSGRARVTVEIDGGRVASRTIRLP